MIFKSIHNRNSKNQTSNFSYINKLFNNVLYVGFQTLNPTFVFAIFALDCLAKEVLPFHFLQTHPIEISNYNLIKMSDMTEPVLLNLTRSKSLEVIQRTSILTRRNSFQNTKRLFVNFLQVRPSAFEPFGKGHTTSSSNYFSNFYL